MAAPDFPNGLTVNGANVLIAGDTVTIQDGGNVISVDDAAGSLTVDAPVATPVFTRLSDGTVALVGQKAMAASLPVVFASDQSALSVSGTFWQATQPVSGPLTDAQLRASLVPVSGPLTDAQLRATPVPVTGGGGTEFAEDSAHTNGDLGKLLLAVRRDGSGPFTSADGDYSALAVDGKGRVYVVHDQALPVGANVIGGVTVAQLPVALAAGGGLKVEGVAGGVAQPVSGTFWQATQPVSIAAVVPVSDNAGSLTVDAPAGTPVFTRLSDGTAALVGQKAMAASLPVVIASDQGGLAVTGTFWQATQPVSGPLTDTQLRASAVPVSLASLPTLAAGTNNIGDVDVLTMPVVQVGDNAGSLTVDGTVTADTELPAAAALGDAMANPTTPLIGAVEVAYDGTQMGRRRSLEAFKTAAAAPDVGLAAVALAERRFTAVTLATPLNSVQSFDCDAASEVVFFIGTTTTGTIIFEVSADGTNWISAEAWQANTNRQVSGISLTPTANDVYRVGAVGQRLIRVRTASTLGGTVAVTATLTPFTAMPQRQATGQGRTLQFAAISAAASGNNTLVAAGAAGLKIKLVSYALIADGTVTVTFQSGAGGTALSGAMALVANAGLVVPGSPSSHIMETAAATLLNASLSAAVGVRGHLSYFLEP